MSQIASAVVPDSPHFKFPQVERVAFVLSELRAGGMERVVVHLARGLASRGVIPRIFCLQSAGALAAELAGTGIDVVAIGSNRAYDFSGLFRLAFDLKSFRPDVINVHDYSSLPYVVASSFLQPGTPIVFTAHGLLYQGFDGKERRYRFFSRRLRALMAVSPEVCQRHQQFINWRGPTFIVPNGVPGVDRSVQIRQQVRQELSIGDDEFVFLAVGNPRPEKAFEDLIDAAAIVQQREPQLSFAVLIAGALRDDAYCRNLQRAVLQAKVPGLRLLGFQSDVSRLYSAADALVVSSRSEGLPMVILEAMTAGLPILSTRVGGIPDAVPTNAGKLVSPASPHELAHAMLDLLYSEPEKLAQMGRAAFQHAQQNFGVDAMTSGYLDVFANLTSGSSGDSYQGME